MTACQKSTTIKTLSQVNLGVNLPRIGLSLTNVCIPQAESLSDYLIRQASLRITSSGVQLDFDRDGISDAVETGALGAVFGLNPAFPDANGDNYGDLAIFTVGMAISSQGRLSYYNCPNPYLDSDGDGLTDCEEKYLLKTNLLKSDSDGDGFPDGLEVRVGLSPLDPADLELITGDDGMSNRTKVKLNLPLDESMSADFKNLWGFRYSLRPSAIQQNGCSSTQSLNVDNIPIGDIPNGNRLDTLIITQTSQGLQPAMCCALVSRKIKDKSTATIDRSTANEQFVLGGRYRKYAGDSTSKANLYCPCPSNDDFNQLEPEISRGL